MSDGVVKEMAMKLSEVLFVGTADDYRESPFIKAPVHELSAQSIEDEAVDEMAIQQFKTVGDWSKRSSFRSDVDRAILTSHRGVEKIRRQWEKTPYDFDIYLVNDPRVNKTDFREVGMVSMDFVRNRLNLTPEEVPDPDGARITVIYVSNTGAERFMASGWILAHRLGHALRMGSNVVASRWNDFTDGLRQKVVQILRGVYGIDLMTNAERYYTRDWKRQVVDDRLLKYFAQALGTMKSARDGKMRSWYEFAYELLAQYMLTGHVKFNPLPRSLLAGFAAYGRKDYRFSRNEDARLGYNTERLRQIEEEVEQGLEDVLGAAVGSVFVM